MTRPISAYASRYGRARAQNYMTAQGRILRMGAPVEDPDTLIYSSGSTTVIYQGKMRVWAVNSSGVLMIGEGEIDTRQTFISIPFSAPVPRGDDIVVVDDFGGDEDLESRAFRIIGVDGGGLTRASRRLTVVTWHESREWDG